MGLFQTEQVKSEKRNEVALQGRAVEHAVLYGMAECALAALVL